MLAENWNLLLLRPYTGTKEKTQILGLGKLFSKLIAQCCNHSSEIGFLASISELVQLCHQLPHVPLAGSVVLLEEHYDIYFISVWSLRSALDEWSSGIKECRVVRAVLSWESSMEYIEAFIKPLTRYQWSKGDPIHRKLMGNVSLKNLLKNHFKDAWCSLINYCSLSQVLDKATWFCERGFQHESLIKAAKCCAALALASKRRRISASWRFYGKDSLCFKSLWILNRFLVLSSVTENSLYRAGHDQRFFFFPALRDYKILLSWVLQRDL